jgi:DNA-binding NarL/FixJ family response regulator
MNYGTATELTPREVQTLQLVAEGFTHIVIAKRMNIGVRTVQTRVRSIMWKLDANNSPHAVAIGIRNGIIE